jgi:tetratricopeptide (TPR) repeat protein
MGAMLASRLPAGHAQSNDEILQRAISAFKAGDFSHAEQMFSLLVKQDSSAINVGYLAMAEASNGDLVQAIAHFQQSIQLGNATASARYNLGIAYLNSHQPEAGIRELRQAVSQDRKYLPARYALGVALVDSRRAGEAIPFLEQARMESPEKPEIWANLVRAEFDAGNDTAALRTVDEAVQSLPDAPSLAVTLAQLCRDHREVQKARYLLENATESMPQNNEVNLLLAKTSMQAGEPIEALAVLKNVPAEWGKPGEVYMVRGEARALTGNLDLAEADLSIALGADPQNESYLEAYAWIEQLRGHHREALATLAKAHDRNPHSPTVSYRLGLSYFSLRQYDQAVGACEEALRLAPDYDAAYLLLGAIKLAQEDFRAAQAAFQHAVSLKPGSALFHRELGIALFRAGSLVESKKELDRASILDAQGAATYFWRARVLASSGKRREAVADLETVVALQPNYRGAYSELAPLYLADGDTQKAAWALAKQKDLPDTPDPDESMLKDLP